MNILKINSSVQTDASVTRKLVEDLIKILDRDGATIVDRDLSKGVSLLSQEMITAFYTNPDDLEAGQKELLIESNTYVQEIKDADVIVFGAPIYNFSVPGSVKAYFDLLARVGVTFKYTEQGPQGLLDNKKVYVAMASGGVPFNSEVDYASKLIRQFLAFLGITDVTFVPADQLMMDQDAGLARAEKIIKEVALAL